MYLVTWEDADGMWLDDPEGFDSEKEARDCAAKYPARKSACVAIYRCDLVATIEATTLSPAQENTP